MLGQMGGMIGASFGPEFAIIGEKVGKMAGEAVEAPAKIVTGSLKLVQNALDGMAGSLGPIGAGLDLASSAADTFVSGVEKVSPALAAVIGPLAQVPAILKGILDTSTRFAGMASPGLLHQFEDAVSDSQAIIGHTFIPILRMMTEGVRLAGDALATILPNAQEMSDALGDFREVFRILGDEVRNVLTENGPLIREFLIANLKLLGAVLKDIIVPQILLVVRAFELLLSPLQILFRLLGVAGGDMRSARGAAARQASFQGVEQYQQEIQLAAFSSGTADVPTQQLNVMQQILTALTNGLTVNIGNWAAQATSSVAGGVAGPALPLAAAFGAAPAGLTWLQRLMLGLPLGNPNGGG